MNRRDENLAFRRKTAEVTMISVVLKLKTPCQKSFQHNIPALGFTSIAFNIRIIKFVSYKALGFGKRQRERKQNVIVLKDKPTCSGRSQKVDITSCFNISRAGEYNKCCDPIIT